MSMYGIDFATDRLVSSFQFGYSMTQKKDLEGKSQWRKYYWYPFTYKGEKYEIEIEEVSQMMLYSPWLITFHKWFSYEKEGVERIDRVPTSNKEGRSKEYQSTLHKAIKTAEAFRKYKVDEEEEMQKRIDKERISEKIIEEEKTQIDYSKYNKYLKKAEERKNIPSVFK